MEAIQLNRRKKNAVVVGENSLSTMQHSRQQRISV
jgi:hypothetical protein